jgi:hypothetical protein
MIVLYIFVLILPVIFYILKSTSKISSKTADIAEGKEYFRYKGVPNLFELVKKDPETD